MSTSKYIDSVLEAWSAYSKKKTGDDVNELMYLNDVARQTAYKAIDDLYGSLEPGANKETQLGIYTEIMGIKKILKDMQYEHMELTSRLNRNGDIYIDKKYDTPIPDKYISKQLESQSREEIVKENYYQLLNKINQSMKMNEDESRFLNSLLMQIIARPAGQKLIVKLNYLLEKNNANISILRGDSFVCKQTAGANAKPIEDNNIVDQYGKDYKSIIKRSIEKSEGAKDALVKIDFNYLQSEAAVAIEAYASPNKGLTDVGPAFILLAHELIHATHNLKGSSRDNVRNFFSSMRGNEDFVMELLYPIDNKFNSVGSEAEEYWTIEGGNTCENSLREENGLSLRTGHISAVPGDQAIRDLYYLGICRDYNEEAMMRFINYTNSHENLDTNAIQLITDDDKYIKNELEYEIQYSQKQTLDKIYEKLIDIPSSTLRRMQQALDGWKQDINNLSNQAEISRSLLNILPPIIRQAIIAIHTLNENDQKDPSHELVKLIQSGKLNQTELSRISSNMNQLYSMLYAYRDYLSPTNHLEFLKMFETTLKSVSFEANRMKNQDSTNAVLDQLRINSGISSVNPSKHANSTNDNQFRNEISGKNTEKDQATHSDNIAGRKENTPKINDDHSSDIQDQKNSPSRQGRM